MAALCLSQAAKAQSKVQVYVYALAAHAWAEHGQAIGLSRDEPGSATTQTGITTGIQYRF